MKFRVFAASMFLSLLSGFAFAQGACSPAGTSVGSGSFNHIINWSQTGDLYFNINNGQHSACGALVVTRNGGSPECTPGWVCTDVNGNASKGPWTWAGQANDEAGTDAHINWPDGTTTYATTNHYWDKTCPTPTINRSNPPPYNFSGTGDDGVGGAGFGAWSKVKLQFKNRAGSYWNPATDTYELASPPDIDGNIDSGLGTIGPGISDSVSYHMNWSAAAFPSSDVPGIYTWTVILKDIQNNVDQSLCANSDSYTFRIKPDFTACRPSIDPGC